VRRADGRYVELTEREWQVLDRLARGQRTGQIARELHVNDATVRGYVRTACQRLRARDRAHAVTLFSSTSAEVDVVIA
jgi:DNA-binding NarL/FixJ family response regulator